MANTLTLTNKNGNIETIDTAVFGKMPKNALALKYADEVDGARWIMDADELDQLRREDAPLAFVTLPSAKPIIDAITAGLRAGGKDEWDAPEFQAARDLTEAAGCVWDFDGWRDTRDGLEASGWLGGVRFAEAREY